MKKNIGSEEQPTFRKAPLFLSLFFMIILLGGIAVDEPSRVLEQAWQICLSCIGVG